MSMALIVIVALVAAAILFSVIKNALEDRERRREIEKIKVFFNECLAQNLFPVTVDYDIQWAGKSERAPTHFYAERTYNYSKARGLPPTLKGVKETNLELLSFKRELTFEEALQEIEKMGYRPAEFLEYESFSKKFSHPSFPFPIVFLGVVATERFNYPPVTRSANGAIAVGCNDRCCNKQMKRWTAESIFADEKWGSECRFTAVKLLE